MVVGLWQNMELFFIITWHQLGSHLLELYNSMMTGWSALEVPIHISNILAYQSLIKYIRLWRNWTPHFVANVRLVQVLGWTRGESSFCKTRGDIHFLFYKKCKRWAVRVVRVHISNIDLRTELWHKSLQNVISDIVRSSGPTPMMR